MLKNILNLKGTQTLNKAEQKSINGGAGPSIDPTQGECTCWFHNFLTGVDTCISYEEEGCVDPPTR